MLPFTAIFLPIPWYAAIVMLLYVSLWPDTYMELCRGTNSFKCIVNSLYNVFLHPLKGYPGPLVAKLTDAYAGFHALMMQLHLATYEDHLKYGKPQLTLERSVHSAEKMCRSGH